MKNGFENFEDFKKMQQDAIKRSHETNMKSKINHNCESHDSKDKCENNKKSNYSKGCDQMPYESKKNFNILDALLSDPEKSLILILIFIFLDEDTNPILIMALMYLLM